MRLIYQTASRGDIMENDWRQQLREYMFSGGEAPPVAMNSEANRQFNMPYQRNAEVAANQENMRRWAAPVKQQNKQIKESYMMGQSGRYDYANLDSYYDFDTT